MSPHASPVRVLLVDADEGVHLRIRELLSVAEHGRYDVHWVPDHAQGLAALSAGHYDVHLIGLTLEGASGIDLIRASEAAGCHAPCLLLADELVAVSDLQALQA